MEPVVVGEGGWLLLRGRPQHRRVARHSLLGVVALWHSVEGGVGAGDVRPAAGLVLLRQAGAHRRLFLYLLQGFSLPELTPPGSHQPPPR